METNRTPGVTFTSNRRVDDCPKTAVPAREYRCPLDSINEASAAQAGKCEIIFDRPMGCEIGTTDKAGGSVGKDSSSHTNFLDLPRSDVEAADIKPLQISRLTDFTLYISHRVLEAVDGLLPSKYTSQHLDYQMVNVAEFGMSNDFMPYSYDDEHFDTTFWRAPEIRGDRHKSDSYIDSKEERPPNVPSVNLAHCRKWRRKHFYLQDETLSKEMLRRTAEEHAASLEITDDKSADCHKFFTVNSVLLNQYRYMSSELERKDVSAEAFRSLVEAADIKPLQISPHLCSLFHLNRTFIIGYLQAGSKFFTDEPLEEITAESSSCLEKNSSRSRKSKRATATVTDDDDLLSKLAPVVKQQIEDALSATLLPLVAVLRSREEKEQKHREQMLALEEQKLALKRQKLALERQNLLLELRRGVKHSGSSHLAGRRQGLKKPRY